MAPGAQVDYDALAKQHGGQSGSGVDYDSLAAAHGGSASSDMDSIVKKYGLPQGTDLSKPLFDPANKGVKDPIAFSNAYNEANPKAPVKGFLSSAWDEAKNIASGAFSQEDTSGSSKPSGNPIPGTELIGTAQQRYQQAKTDLPGALGRTTTDVATAALPILLHQAGNIWSKFSPAASVEEALSTKLTAAEADTPRPGGQIQPALNNTPREVLQHASDEGIKLTPGQATESGLAQQLQKAGTNAAVGGKELAAALQEQKMKFGESVNGFMDDVDPKRMGLSAESAGETIKDVAQKAKSVSHDNAAQGYQKIDYLMDKPIDPAPISAAWNKMKADLPMGAEEQILAQTPRSMRGVVQDLLSGNPEGFKPTFSQGIQLRSFFRELGDIEGLPSKTQGIFKQMSGVTDGAMESTAGQGGSIEDWRNANAGWKDYAQKYGDPQSVLYKAIKSNDPVRTVTMLQNAPATVIETLKKENMQGALEPLRRQVIQDIAQSRFNVGHDGIGGYSDSYLKTLFSPEQVKELYLKGDLANRLKYDPNPSGTAGGLQSVDQLGFLKQGKMSVAAKMSMPRDPLSFLPEGVKSPASSTALPSPLLRETSPITGGAMANPDELFRRAAQ